MAAGVLKPLFFSFSSYHIPWSKGLAAMREPVIDEPEGASIKAFRTIGDQDES